MPLPRVKLKANALLGLCSMHTHTSPPSFISLWFLPPNCSVALFPLQRFCNLAEGEEEGMSHCQHGGPCCPLKGIRYWSAPYQFSACALSFQLGWIPSHLITGGKPRHGQGVGQEHLVLLSWGLCRKAHLQGAGCQGPQQSVSDSPSCANRQKSQHTCSKILLMGYVIRHEQSLSFAKMFHSSYVFDFVFKGRG